MTHSLPRSGTSPVCTWYCCIRTTLDKHEFTATLQFSWRIESDIQTDYAYEKHKLYAFTYYALLYMSVYLYILRFCIHNVGLCETQP